MKARVEDEKGNTIFEHLWCDVCEIESGPRTLIDDCLNCGSTKTERLVKGRKKIADMRMSVYKKVLFAEAKAIRERFGFDVELTVKYRIIETPEVTKKILKLRKKLEF